MTSQFVSELSAASNVNERAAAYAGEILRLEAVNAQLLAALKIVSNCVPDSEGGTTLGTWEMQRVRAAISKAKGE